MWSETGDQERAGEAHTAQKSNSCVSSMLDCFHRHRILKLTSDSCFENKNKACHKPTSYLNVQLRQTHRHTQRRRDKMNKTRGKGATERYVRKGMPLDTAR